MSAWGRCQRLLPSSTTYSSNSSSQSFRFNTFFGTYIATFLDAVSLCRLECCGHVFRDHREKSIVQKAAYLQLHLPKYRLCLDDVTEVGNFFAHTHEVTTNWPLYAMLVQMYGALGWNELLLLRSKVFLTDDDDEEEGGDVDGDGDGDKVNFFFMKTLSRQSIFHFSHFGITMSNYQMSDVLHPTDQKKKSCNLCVVFSTSFFTFGFWTKVQNHSQSLG